MCVWFCLFIGLVGFCRDLGWWWLLYLSFWCYFGVFLIIVVGWVCVCWLVVMLFVFLWFFFWKRNVWLWGWVVCCFFWRSGMMCSVGYIRLCVVSEIMFVVVIMKWLSMWIFIRYRVFFKCEVSIWFVGDGLGFLFGWLCVSMIVMVFKDSVCWIIMCGCILVLFMELENRCFMVMRWWWLLRKVILKCFWFFLFSCRWKNCLVVGGFFMNCFGVSVFVDRMFRVWVMMVFFWLWEMVLWEVMCMRGFFVVMVCIRLFFWLVCFKFVVWFVYFG